MNRRLRSRSTSAARLAPVTLLLLVLAGAGCASSRTATDEAGRAERVRGQLAANAAAFSAAYVRGDVDAMMAFYTEDAVLFPGNRDLVKGPEAVRAYWTLGPGRRITAHAMQPLEVQVVGDTAYDYGYYQVSGENGDEAWGPNHGKYLVVWQQGQDGAWRMRLDMWNSRPPPSE